MRQSCENCHALPIEPVVVFERNVPGEDAGSVSLRKPRQVWRGSGFAFENDAARGTYKAGQRRIQLVFVHVEKVEVAV